MGGARKGMGAARYLNEDGSLDRYERQRLELPRVCLSPSRSRESRSRYDLATVVGQARIIVCHDIVSPPTAAKRRFTGPHAGHSPTV